MPNAAFAGRYVLFEARRPYRGQSCCRLADRRPEKQSFVADVQHDDALKKVGAPMLLRAERGDPVDFRGDTGLEMRPLSRRFDGARRLLVVRMALAAALARRAEKVVQPSRLNSVAVTGR